MNKRSNRILLLFSAVGIVFLLIVIFLREPMPKRSEETTAEQAAASEQRMHSVETDTRIREIRKAAPRHKADGLQREQNQMTKDWERELILWQSPVLYFGKVVDENGLPIKGVTVSYGANSLSQSLAEVYNQGTVSTDDRGIFKIDKVKGIGLKLELSHPDYYPYPENSTGFDKRSLPQKGYFSDSERSAELFRMHKKGNAVSLIFRESGFHTPYGGTAKKFTIRGESRQQILGNLQIQGWNNLRAKTNSFDWKVRLTLDEGGIQEKTNLFDFIAPETGYSKSVDINIGGSESARKEYFLQLPNGYVRFDIRIIMSKDMFIVGGYFFNPDGSRNLEPDSSRIIRPNE